MLTKLLVKNGNSSNSYRDKMGYDIICSKLDNYWQLKKFILTNRAHKKFVSAPIHVTSVGVNKFLYEEYALLNIILKNIHTQTNRFKVFGEGQGENPSGCNVFGELQNSSLGCCV